MAYPTTRGFTARPGKGVETDPQPVKVEPQRDPLGKMFRMRVSLVHKKQDRVDNAYHKGPKYSREKWNLGYAAIVEREGKVYKLRDENGEMVKIPKKELLLSERPVYVPKIAIRRRKWKPKNHAEWLWLWSKQRREMKEGILVTPQTYKETKRVVTPPTLKCRRCNKPLPESGEYLANKWGFFCSEECSTATKPREDTPRYAKGCYSTWHMGITASESKLAFAG